MPIFEYQNYASPYVNSIAQVIGRQNDPYAEAARIKGDLAARAIEAGGAANAGLMRGLFGTVSDLADKTYNAYQTAPKREAEKLALDRARKLAAGETLLDQVASVNAGRGTEPLPPGAAGPQVPSIVTSEGLYDIPKINQFLASSGYTSLAPELIKGLEQTNASITQLNVTKQKLADHQTMVRGDAAHLALGVIERGKGTVSPTEAVNLVMQPGIGGLTPEQISDFHATFDTLAPDQQLQYLQSQRAAADLLDKKEAATEYGRLGRYDTTPVGAAPRKANFEQTQITLDRGDGKGPQPVVVDHDKTTNKYFWPGTQTEVPIPAGSATPYKAPNEPARGQQAEFRINTPQGPKDVKGVFLPTDTGGRYMYDVNGDGKLEDVTALRVPPQPPASVQLHQQIEREWSPEQIDFYARQVKEDASKWNLVPTTVRDRVGQRIATLGGDITKISESSRLMAEMAKEILPHMPEIQDEAKRLAQLNLLGPIGGRWRDFMAGKIGAGELAGGSTEAAELIGKFRTNAGLLKTAVARAHGGARGGGSPTMLEHMNSLFGSDTADLSTLTGELSAFTDWMQGYSNMLPSSLPDAGTAAPGQPLQVGGFTVTIK